MVVDAYLFTYLLPYLFETRSLGAHPGLEFATAPRMNSWSSCHGLPSVGSEYHCTPFTSSAGNGTQSFLHARQTAYQLSYIYGPYVFKKKKNSRKSQK